MLLSNDQLVLMAQDQTGYTHLFSPVPQSPVSLFFIISHWMEFVLIICITLSDAYRVLLLSFVPTTRYLKKTKQEKSMKCEKNDCLQNYNFSKT